mgnify:CR=1 FL=1
MKTITTYIGLIFILSAISCEDFNKGSSKYETMVMSVLEDITEPDFIASPDPNIIIDRFDLGNDIWKSAHFRYRKISQLDYTPLDEIVLPLGNELFENSLLRNKKVSSFKNRIIEVVTKEKDTFLQTHSSIFNPILRELQALSKLTADRKELIVFSDLKENSNFYSWYLSRDYKILNENPDLVVEKFLQQVPQDFDVSGVSLQIIYIPYDAKDNQEFMKLVKVYKEVFRRLKIPLTISANM